MMPRFFLFFLINAWFFSASSLFAAGPHDDSQVRCLNCHGALPLGGGGLRFHVDIQDICLRCHGAYSCKPQQAGNEFRHPVSVVAPFPIPADMPLDGKNRIGCTTCHLFHEGTGSKEDLPVYLLRRPFGPTFCITCHRKLVLP
ncbi:MAG: cytochrome c3 family protein [Proteobacteria bacterium]|nr:cytochrome c3 family protein [Pseudomonadota bacterium]MBU4296964.1 cytochrome c3 family protein [Pseudomonadota bacterium]MCG2748562.1 cytochrome c3 family protein [Desulfobulbaceae bacterium]